MTTVNLAALTERPPRNRVDVNVKGWSAFWWANGLAIASQMIILPYEAVYQHIEFTKQTNPDIPTPGVLRNMFQVLPQTGLGNIYRRGLSKAVNYALHTSVPYAAFFVSKNYFYPDLPVFAPNSNQQVPNFSEVGRTGLKIAGAAALPAALLAIPLHPAQNVRKVLFELMAANKKLQAPTPGELGKHIDALGGYRVMWRGLLPAIATVAMFRGVTFGGFYAVKPFIHPNLSQDTPTMFGKALALSLVVNYIGRVLAAPFSVMSNRILPIKVPHVNVRFSTAILLALRPSPMWINASLTLALFDLVFVRRAKAQEQIDIDAERVQRNATLQDLIKTLR